MGRAIGGNAAIEERLAAAPGLAHMDGHALAGFIDAEGSFTIKPNNAGRTWTCSMTLAVRLDDGGLVHDLAQTTGLGRIHVKAAHRTSRPQAVWNIASKRECTELVRMLRTFPLRARKRGDFEIWSSAVDRWASMPYRHHRDPGFHAFMADAHSRIRHVRCYVDSPPSAVTGPESELLAYLGGFFTGEGCFALSALAPRAVIKLRRDDRSILELFAATFGLGGVRDHAAYGGDNASVTWLVCATRELAPAVELFEAAQLRGRKRLEFETWREAAHERAFAALAGRRWDRTRMQGVADRLKQQRVYVAPDVVRTPTDQAREARSAYIAVLRAFANEAADGLLSTNAYKRARERHPDWPTRNTIARAFGSWAQALRAAELAPSVASGEESSVSWARGSSGRSVSV